MNTFKQYYELFLEAKANPGVKLHLSHLEDLVIDSAGIRVGVADGIDSSTIVVLGIVGNRLAEGGDL